jgi:cell division protein FtsB
VSDDQLSRAHQEIERLTAERDEARREVCEMRSEELVDPITSPKQIAQQRGWDCYKKEDK